MFHDPKQPSAVVGFEVDIAKALGRELGESIEHVQYEYGSLLVGLERGDLDLVMNGIEITADRKVKVRFSRPYYLYRLQWVVRVDDKAHDSIEACLATKCTVGTLGDLADELLEVGGLIAVTRSAVG